MKKNVNKNFYKNITQVGDLNVVVEIDKSQFGKRK